MSPRPARACALALLAALAAPTLGCGGESGEGPAGPDAGPPPEVGVVELEAQEVSLSTLLPGRSSAYRIAEVRPQVSGIVQERLFQQGERVERGEVLYRIDPQRYRAAVARAEAELASARADRGEVRTRERRTAALLEREAVSQQQYDQVEAELEQADAAVERARAERETARIELDYTTVKAPIDGVAGPTLVTEGALVTENQEQPLARVTRLDPIYVDIARSVRELRWLRRQLESGRLEEVSPGRTPVTLVFQDGSEYGRTGRLQLTDVTVNPSTGSVTLRAIFPNPERELLPGMYVRARLTQGVQEDAILAPQQGVTRSPRGEATALVVKGDGTLERRTLELGRAIGSFWLVKEGLADGERLVVTGLQGVEPGDSVRTVAADIPNRPEAAPGGPRQEAGSGAGPAREGPAPPEERPASPTSPASGASAASGEGADG